MFIVIRDCLFCSLLITVLLFSGSSCSRMPEQRGITLGLFSEDPEWSYQKFIDEIKAVGASHIAIAVPWYVEKVDSNVVKPHPRFTVPMSTVSRVVTQSKDSGLGIMLFPFIRIEKPGPGDWRGNLKPANRAAFFASYASFVGSFALLARDMDIKAIVIGSELSSLDTDKTTWAEIILGIRRIHPGLRLVYSANWDHFEKVPFWDLVDDIGVSGYFELTDGDRKPTVQKLTSSWLGHRHKLEDLARKNKKPLILTEVGYLSQDGTNAWPWKEGAKETVDLEEQAMCFTALRNAWRGSDVLKGLFIWNWFGWGGKSSGEYTPRGKPAQEVIRKWFAGRKSLYTDFRKQHKKEQEKEPAD